MQSKYTGIRADRPIIPHIVKKDLIPALSMVKSKAQQNTHLR